MYTARALRIVTNIFCAAVLCLGAACANKRATEPAPLRCSLVYAGEAQTEEIQATRDPYGVKPTDVSGRFVFKAVYMTEPQAVASINLYVYALVEPNPLPVLLQQVKYTAPYPQASRDARYGFTGRQFLYSSSGREFQYWCALGAP